MLVDNGLKIFQNKEGMKGRMVSIVIVVLVVTAIGLGYIIFKGATKRSPEQPSVITPSIQTTTPSSTRQLSEEEQVLKFPGPDASEEEIKKHGELVDSLSQQATVLDITNCSPSPVVTLVNPSTTIIVRNSGFTEQTIVRADKAVTIPAGGEVKVTISSLIGSDDLGNLGYSCQGIPGPVGVFQVGPE